MPAGGGAVPDGTARDARDRVRRAGGVSPGPGDAGADRDRTRAHQPAQRLTACGRSVPFRAVQRWSSPALPSPAREVTGMTGGMARMLWVVGLAVVGLGAEHRVEDGGSLGAMSARPGKPVIARAWHGKTPREKADAYERYLAGAITKFPSI